MSEAGDGSDMNVFMESHNDGEVWGLAEDPNGNILSSGDDNKLMCWDPKQRKCIKKMMVTADKKNVKGASSQSSKPSSQQARAVTFFNGCCVVACNDGSVRIKNMDGADVQVLSDSKQWIEVLQVSPDCSKLAVGSHDNMIRVYDSSYNLVGTCRGHSSYITAVDWDESSKIMRSNSGDYELLFWDENCNQDASGRSNYQNTVWASHTAKMAWTVEGIYPKGADGTFINSVCASPDGQFIMTGNDNRLWSVFNNPVRFNHKPRSYRGHAEFVTNVINDKEGNKVFTAGGQDMTVMQWNKC